MRRAKLDNRAPQERGHPLARGGRVGPSLVHKEQRLLPVAVRIVHHARVARHVVPTLHPERVAKGLQRNLAVGPEGGVAARAAVDVRVHVSVAQQAHAVRRGKRALLLKLLELRGQKELLADEREVGVVSVAPPSHPNGDAAIAQAARPLLDGLVGWFEEQVVVSLWHDLELLGWDRRRVDQVGH